MLFSFYYKFPNLTRYTWPKKCSNNLLFHYKQSTLICSRMGGAEGMTYLLFGYHSSYSNNFSNWNISFQTLPLHIKLHLYVMVEVKTIPSTVHVPCPSSYLTAQVRNFYEVTFYTNFNWWLIFYWKKIWHFFKKTNKNKEISCMKSIKMHEKPHQNPMGF